jgi:hypothetical protein
MKTKIGGAKVNCTPIVRQYDILKLTIGVFFYAKRSFEGCIYGSMKAGYTGALKQQVVEDMRDSKLSQNQASLKYEVPRSVIQSWERIYKKIQILQR